MLKEYAVEPAAIGRSWETFRYLIEKFGFAEGRLISRFPGKWSRLVLEAADAAEIQPVARQRMVEKLRAEKDTVLIKAGREYDSNLPSWIDNAAQSHAEAPFHAVVVENSPGAEVFVEVDAFDNSHQLMHVARSADVPRTAHALADACSLLLFTAREIDIVDPYLYLIERASAGYRDTIREILANLNNAGRANVCVRLHYKNTVGCPPEGHIIQNAAQWFRGIIPATYTVQLTTWEEIPGGEDFHDRFILTDRGGLQVGSGLSAAGANENATVSILDTQHAEDIRSKFNSSSGVYLQSGRIIQVNSLGTASLI